MKIIDAHAHIFSEIKGERQGKKIKSLDHGKIQVGDEIQQLLPESFETNTFSAAELIKLMDTEDVEYAVLLQNPVFGIINEEIRNALLQYPNRFRGTIQVDPYAEDASAIIKQYATDLQNTVKFELSEGWGWSGKYPKLSLIDAEFLELLELINALKLRVIIDPGEVSNNGYQVENIYKLATDFPEINFLIEHLGYLTEAKLTKTESVNRWKSMIKLGQTCKNVFFGFSAFPTLINDNYPFNLSCSLLREVIEIISPDKLLWGSDIPTTLGKYSYKQLKNIVMKQCAFIDEIDKTKIMRLNAAKYFQII